MRPMLMAINPSRLRMFIDYLHSLRGHKLSECFIYPSTFRISKIRGSGHAVRTAAEDWTHGSSLAYRFLRKEQSCSSHWSIPSPVLADTRITGIPGRTD